MEGDPAVSGRWGPSVVLCPNGAAGAALDALTTDALAVAGPGHWATGSCGAAHVTVRALARRGDPTRAAHADALRRAFVEPVTVTFAGLRRTGTAVLALATVDAATDRLRSRYAEELGTDAAFEDAALAPTGRTGWYATIVHFDAPVEDGLHRWVAARRHVDIGAETFHEAVVCEWRFDPERHCMVPEPVATVRCR